ncbi:MAG: hypothetical protein HYY10_02310 [Candidatus Liptonbacteria bacterium]|nr:hypothetical protein [Candidatus Liptonbacteria bacterium]
MRAAYLKLAQWVYAIALGTGFLWLVFTFVFPIDQAFMDAFNRHQAYWFGLIAIGLVASWIAKRAKN